MKFFLKLSKSFENYFLKIAKFFKNFLAHLALISLILEQFIFVASATAQALPIVPDGSTNTQITQTASGIDQINIAHCLAINIFQDRQSFSLFLCLAQ